MLHALLEFVANLVASVILTLIFLPVCLVVATPVIFVLAPFRPGRIRSDYAAVVRWWEKWGPVTV